MSSPRAQGQKPKSPAAAAKPARKAASGGEPSKSDKAAFLKAMWEGIPPGSKAAEKSAARKTPAKTPAKKVAAKAAAPAAPKVEVLRRISGSAPAEASTPETQKAIALAAELEKLIIDGKLESLQPPGMQALMAALCKLYSAQEDMGARYPVLNGRGAVTGTDVMIVCGSLLKAVDLQVFELGMWQTWSGR